MGIPSCSPDHITVGNSRRDHFHLARPHRRKSHDTHGIIASSCFRNIPRKLDVILDRKEQGPEGQKCWHADEPVQHALTQIHIYRCTKIQILGMHISMTRHQTCPVHLTHTHHQMLTPVFVHTYTHNQTPTHIFVHY